MVTKEKTTPYELIAHSDTFVTLVCDKCGDVVQYVRQDKLPEQIKEGWHVNDDEILCPKC